MRAKLTVLTTLAAFLVLTANSLSLAVNTTKIDQVRKKGLLDETDFQIIDEFVDQAVQELVETGDFTSTATIRAAVLQRKHSGTGNQAQYAYRRLVEWGYVKQGQ